MPPDRSERTELVATPDGRRLAVHEAGAPRGRPVFVLHGTPGSGLLYPPWIDDAARRGLRLIAYDRPGYGGSTPRPGRTVADAADDVRSIADALGIDRFAVWGISGGGPHALACGARCPGRAIAVASLAAPAPREAAGLAWHEGMGEGNREEFRAAEAGPAALEAFLVPQREAFVRGDRASIDAGFSTLLSPADRSVYDGALSTHLTESGRAGLAPGIDGWRDDDLALVRPWGFDLGAVRVPTLLWHGREDRFVPFAHGQWLGNAIGHAVRNLSDDDGHLTLYVRRIPAVHSWIASAFSPR
ncbi:MAG: alpha/beta hydrolase [Thermoplasmata archaeon]